MSDFNVSTLSAASIVDASGDTLGKVAEVYLDDRTAQPQWVTVRLGPSGAKEVFVPLAAARLVGGVLMVDATTEQVSGAPQVHEDGRVSGQEETEIYRYYGLTGPGAGDGTANRPVAAGEIDPSGTGSDLGTGPGSDPGKGMTRSEERLVAGTREEMTARVRLRRYVVTEIQTVQVPVRREEVRLEHEPITAAERDAAYAGGSVTDITDITEASDEEREMILHAERPVMTTETVPVERIRMNKETVRATEAVAGEVRKERIELEDPSGTAHTE